MSNVISDQQQRERAIDPKQSFIVQAPAGSGKTELLTQRFLQLLSYVDNNPEEIIAITFTRKAAAEMRQRVIDALTLANHAPLPIEPHKQTTWQLAKNALQRDKEQHWNLIQNPNRLRILTIDALSAYLVRQMPITSQLSSALSLIENPRIAYQEAVETVLMSLADNPSWKPSIQRLLLHLDNNVMLLQRLLIQILSKREQWLPHITGYQHNASALQKHMNEALINLAKDAMTTTQSLLSDDILAELIPLASVAGHYCTEEDPENPIAQCHALQNLSQHIESLPAWQGIAHLLLTQKGEWRKSVTKRQGFPPKSELKPQMIAFLNDMQNDIAFKEALFTIMQLPPLHYDDQQWQIIEALLETLPILAAQLNVIFSRDGVCDFVELNIAALRALGDADQPTDLAMHLDYRMNHLLIDEFQDTSIIQFQLIEQLIAEWQPDDGRTLFLVGDPMQSIYRFRNAEVGLFLRAQQHGIANIALHSLQLTQNFRSQKAIIDWNNENFSEIFPKSTDITIGAAPYAPAFAATSDGGHVQWHPNMNDDGSAEANDVVRVIQRHQDNAPDDSIALLVRSRSHLSMITKHLHQNGIRFQAIELEALIEQQEIHDIHILTRALLHYADRIAWLALLRAPFCGLKLEDLFHIAQAARHKTIWSALKNDPLLVQLSTDAQLRLQHCLPALHHAIDNIGRAPLSQILRTLWNALNGPDTLSNAIQSANIDSYLRLIESLETKNQCITLNDINEQLQYLYAESITTDQSTLQIMTIHKAKGLEFDHVLLPGLHRKSPNERQQIFKWLERPNQDQKSDLILAPIKAVSDKSDEIYNYLKRIEKQKADLEYARLLYVAATRAKKSLHLFANVTMEDDALKPPERGCFLHLLWHQAEPYFQNVSIQAHHEAIEQTHTPTLRRFKQNYFENQTIPIYTKTAFSQPIKLAVTHYYARQLGTLIHEALEQLGRHEAISSKFWETRLKHIGLSLSDQDKMNKEIQHAITQIKNDPRGQWILSSQHDDSQYEFALTFMDGEDIKNIVIDRTFIDDNGTRWIIDYKTGTPSDAEMESYRQQLETYANALHLREKRPIQLGLYFPMDGQWIEWEFSVDPSELVVN